MDILDRLNAAGRGSDAALMDDAAEEIARLRAEDEQATKIIDALNAENDALRLDSERLDWLEKFVSENEGIVLHQGGYKISENKIRYSGIGLAGTGRALRAAIDEAIAGNRTMVKAERKYLDQLGGTSASVFESMRISAIEEETTSLRAEAEANRVDAERACRQVAINALIQGYYSGRIVTGAGVTAVSARQWAADFADNTPLFKEWIDAAIDAARGKDNG
jgi:hypothetical protein